MMAFADEAAWIPFGDYEIPSSVFGRIRGRFLGTSSNAREAIVKAMLEGGYYNRIALLSDMQHLSPRMSEGRPIVDIIGKYLTVVGRKVDILSVDLSTGETKTIPQGLQW
jgi:hypothetical protein